MAKTHLWQPKRHRFLALPVLLLRAKEASIQNVRSILRDYGMTEQQWRVLRSLYDAKILSASELAEGAFLSMTSISRITKHLNAEKLITRKNDLFDKRIILFSITRKGQKLCSKVGPALENKHKETFDRIDSIDMNKLETSLNLLVKELGGLTIPGS